ncbi:hypothetical protein C5E45_00515 [Nocardia nova]|uniref:ESX-1 secretion-associated protein n=1 Tax=Nocardia nova TaxID=37330 RepID=A0A2S6AWW0_9NOCA|nr:hypothetical protein C5E41_13735 [Nocardia nova]PPJ39683.1 hypothetical protein C5E45_00515 [Nocardia nova]
MLRVDIDALGKAVQSLRGSEQVLDDAMGKMAEGGHGSIGTKELDDAADSFQRRWHYGIQRIGEMARATADGIDRCRDTYQQTDDALAQILAQVGETVATEGETTA